MTDITSRSFGSNISLFCKNNTDLLNLFNNNFPLPNQACWTVFSPTKIVSMKVISVLRKQHFEICEWLQLKKAGRYVGKIGVHLLELWEWSLGYRMPTTSSEFGASQVFQLAYACVCLRMLAYAWSTLVKKKRCQFTQSLRLSRPLER